MEPLNPVIVKSLQHEVMTSKEEIAFFENRREVHNDMVDLMYRNGIDSFIPKYVQTAKSLMYTRKSSLKEIKAPYEFALKLESSTDKKFSLSNTNYYVFCRFVEDYLKNNFSFELRDLNDYLYDHRRITVESNIKLVGKIARKHRYRSDYEDIYQNAVQRLVNAWEKFDERKNFKFSSYSSNWIRQGITKYLKQNESRVGLNESSTARVRKFREVLDQLTFELGSPPSIDELVERTGKSKISVQSLLNLNPQPYYIDETSEFDMHEYLPAPAETNNYEDREFKSSLLELIKPILKPREFDIIIKYYGLNGTKKNLEQIGSDYNLTRERIRQIRNVALNKLRKKKELRDEFASVFFESKN